MNRYAVLHGEIYDPLTGDWSLTAPISEGRNYHSTAILLRDGRVLVGGGHPGGNPREPRLLSFEIFSPDYLSRGPRPIFSIDKTKVGPVSEITIRLAGKWRYEHIHPRSICLIRCYTVTHAFATDQRCVFLDPYVDVETTDSYMQSATVYPEGDSKPLEKNVERPTSTTTLTSEFPQASDAEFKIKIPHNRNIVPSGYYMLFLSSSLEDGLIGTPAIAKMIHVL